MCFAPSKGEPREGTKIVTDQKSTAIHDGNGFPAIDSGFVCTIFKCIASVRSHKKPDKKTDTIYKQM